MTTDALTIIFLVFITLLIGLIASWGYIGWRAWNKVRRTRLRWAIVHANLLTTLVLISLLVVREEIVNLTALNPQLATVTPLLTFAAILVPPVISTVLALPFIVASMLLAAGAAFYLIQPITNSIELLASRMDCVQGGDYAARCPVEGQVEIQRLQIGFNDMAAELEKNISLLRQERDSISRLLAARRELFAEVSHELRTPAATMRGYMDSILLHWHEQPPATLRADVEIIGNELERLQRLIDDLFLLARAEVGRLTLNIVASDIGALVSRAVQATAALAWERSRVRVISEIPNALPHANADAARLEQVLHNLLQNAVRHTGPGGIVAIKLRVEDATLCLDVCDTGEGIAAGDLAHIWERFYSASDHAGSAGIGLSLVREFTLAMGGTITVDSTAGQGTCFSITLNVAHAAV